VPAQQLGEFNSQILNRIELVQAFFGESFHGYIPSNFGLRGKTAFEQFVALSEVSQIAGMDFILEIKSNHKAVFINYPFWSNADFAEVGIPAAERERVLKGIASVWASAFPEVSLLGQQNRNRK